MRKQTELSEPRDTVLLDRENTSLETPARNGTSHPDGEETTRNHAPDNRAATAPSVDRSGVETAPDTHEEVVAPEEGSPAKRSARPWLKPLMLTILLVALVFGAIWGYHYLQFSHTHVSTDDAYLTTDIVQVTPQVAGNVTQILVKENQTVKAGQLLAVLDDSTFRAAVDQAKANLAVAQASAQGAASSVGVTAQTGSAQIEQAAGGVAQAESAIASAQADVERVNAAIANAQAGTLSARANVGTAQAALQATVSARQRAVEAVRSAQAQVETAQAAVRSAQAAVEVARANADKAGKDQVRYASLYRQNAISAQEVDASAASANAANAQLDSARQLVAQNQATVAQKQADLSSAREAIHTADANIAQAKAQLAAAHQGVTAAQATVRQTQAQYRASQQNVVQAQAKRAQAVGQLNQAHTAPKQVDVSRANQKTANAHILEAQAALENAAIDLRRTRIYAPTGGTITEKTLEVGQQVAVGQAIMAVIPINDLWVDANFKETQLGGVRAGQPAEIEVDTFPGRRFKGHVDSIAPATGATFALLPPDNATGNFTKVVQRIPVKIVLDPGQPDMSRLRGGLSAVVTITIKD